MKKILALSLAIMIILSFSACSTSNSSKTATKSDIKIGDLQDITGATSALGKMVQAGAQWAVDGINSKGGINGRKIKLITYDTKGQVQEAINDFNLLCSSDKVSAIIGPPIANIDIAIAPISDKYNVPVLQFALDTRANLKADGKPYKNMFLLQPSADQQGAIMATYAAKEKGYKKFGIIYNQSNAYSISLVAAFKKTAADLPGVSIAAEVPYQATDKDFKTMLGKLTAAHVDAIFAPNYIQELTLITQQAREIGYNGPLICGLDAAPPFASVCGPESNGIVYIDNIEDSDPAIQTIMSDFKQKTGNDATDKFFLGDDVMNIIAQTIKNVGDDPAAVQKAIESLNGYKGYTGTITMNPDNHETKGLSMFIDEIVNQQPQTIKKYSVD